MIVGANSSSGYIDATWDGGSPTFTAATNANINFTGAMNATAPGASRISFLGFTLPTLGAGFQSATINFNMRSTDAVSSDPWFNLDAYGFTTAPTTSDFYIGSLDATKTLVANNFVTPSTTDGQAISINTTAFLAAFYDAGGNPTVSAVYFRFNPDDADGSLAPVMGDPSQGDGFGRYRSDLFNGAGAPQATLMVTAVPEPSSVALLGLGAAALVAIRRRRRMMAE